MSTFDKTRTTTYSPFVDIVSISCGFPDIAHYLPKVAVLRSGLSLVIFGSALARFLSFRLDLTRRTRVSNALGICSVFHAFGK